MKLHIRLFIPTFFIGFVFMISGCEKEKIEPDHIYSNLHDIIIQPNQDVPVRDSKIFNLDIDKNGSTDITITTYRNVQYHDPSESYIRISTLNGYEVETMDFVNVTWYINGFTHETMYIYDTVPIPFIFNDKDTISINEGTWKESATIAYLSYADAKGRGYVSDSEIDAWLNINYKYMAFRNLTEHRLVWLKLKVIGSSSIVLSGYMIFRYKDEITID